MGYLKDVEIALDLTDKDKERLAGVAREVRQNEENTNYTKDELLKQYNLTEAETLAIKNGSVSSDPVPDPEPKKEEEKPEDNQQANGNKPGDKKTRFTARRTKDDKVQGFRKET